MSISRNLYVLLISCLILPHAPLNAADLVDIYREALDQDAQYAAARAEHKAAQEKIPQGRAGLLPTLTLSGVRKRQMINPEGSPEVGLNRGAIVIQAVQPLFRMQNFIAYEQSKIQVMQADSQFIIASQDLILRVSQAYFDLLIAQFDVRVEEDQKRAIERQLKQAKANFEAGNSTMVDTKEAQARFDLSVSKLIVARNVLEINKRKLQKITGRYPSIISRSHENHDTNLFVLKYANMNDWLAVAQQNSLTIRVQQLVLEMAEHEVKRARAGHYPTLDLVALYSNQKGVGGTFTGRGIDLTSKEIGLQLNIPLFSGFAVQSRVREAMATEEKVRDLKNTYRDAELNVSQEFLNFTNGRALVKAQIEAVRSSQSQLESTKLGQEVGVRTEVNVLNAQGLHSLARRDLSRAYYNLLMSRLKLKAAAGELDEEDLVQINKVLQ